MINFIERISLKHSDEITPKEKEQIQKAIQKLSGNNPNIDLVCDLRAKLAEIESVQVIAGGKRKTRRRRRKQRKTRRR